MFSFVSQLIVTSEREHSVRLMELQQKYNTVQMELQQTQLELYHGSALKRHSQFNYTNSMLYT